MTERFGETAYAKINLALHVRARRPDGYHEIETLFAFADDGDQLTAEAAGEVTLRIDGPFAADLSHDDNLVLKAAEALRAATGCTQGAALQLTKRLPVASGIGGGSADAAAALRLLRRMWKLDIDDNVLREIAAPLGADVPACIGSVTVAGMGRGDSLRPAKSGFEGAPLLLVNPRIPLATAPVFAGWDGQDRGSLKPAHSDGWRNDLAEAASALVPQIAQLLALLERQPGVILARMSGSGATCFATFDTNTARDAAALAFPHCWTLATRVRSV